MQPRVLARTEIIQRQVVVLREGQLAIEEDLAEQEEETELTDSARWYLDFWQELLDGLKFDDPEQPMAKPNKKGNLFFAMPPSMSEAWLSAFFVQGKGMAGVYLTFASGSLAERLWEGLSAEREQIEKETGLALTWNNPREGKYDVSTVRIYDDPRNPKNREEIKAFMRDALNRYVNAFRPRLSRLTEQ